MIPVHTIPNSSHESASSAHKGLALRSIVEWAMSIHHNGSQKCRRGLLGQWMLCCILSDCTPPAYALILHLHVSAALPTNIVQMADYQIHPFLPMFLRYDFYIFLCFLVPVAISCYFPVSCHVFPTPGFPNWLLATPWSPMLHLDADAGTRVKPVDGGDSILCPWTCGAPQKWERTKTRI